MELDLDQGNNPSPRPRHLTLTFGLDIDLCDLDQFKWEAGIDWPITCHTDQIW